MAFYVFLCQERIVLKSLDIIWGNFVDSKKKCRNWDRWTKALTYTYISKILQSFEFRHTSKNGWGGGGAKTVFWKKGAEEWTFYCTALNMQQEIAIFNNVFKAVWPEGGPEGSHLLLVRFHLVPARVHALPLLLNVKSEQ